MASDGNIVSERYIDEIATECMIDTYSMIGTINRWNHITDWNNITSDTYTAIETHDMIESVLMIVTEYLREPPFQIETICQSVTQKEWSHDNRSIHFNRANQKSRYSINNATNKQEITPHQRGVIFYIGYSIEAIRQKLTG